VIGIGLESVDDRPLSILALGAHCDDIEIGCAGTILQMLSEMEADVTWVVFAAAKGDRADEARESAEALLAGARSSRIVLEEFEDAFFPYDGRAIKRRFEELKDEVAPDVIFTHQRDDLHQDHRLVCELAWNTFRHHLLLEYEIPKYDGDLSRTNLYSPLTEDTVERKLDHLFRHFSTQRTKEWFTPDLFRGLMRVRGMEANAASGFAEAFVARKLVLRGATL
jgi:LmbE family N-acetylglucosaminyl deacetylase